MNTPVQTNAWMHRIGVVLAHLTYYTGAQSTPREYDFQMWLTYDGAANLWLFDQNFIL